MSDSSAKEPSISGDPSDTSVRSRLRDKEGVVGKVLNGKYRVLEILARGGMGAVYRAEQLPLGRPVALKLIHSALDDDHPDSEFQKRFFLEAASCAKLTHPNIVIIHDFGEIELSPGRTSAYMAMELLEGTTLHDVLKSEAPLTFGRALRITREVARALREAHRQSMVHRDLKPTNVMLSRTSDGESVKVLDFGLVKLLRDDSEQLTREDLFMGSPKYMAPEQVERGPLDGRADLYALGVLAYEMLSGRVPFAGEHQVQTLMAHVRDAPPPLPDDVPASITTIVMKLLEKQPADRFQSADALVGELDRVLGTLGTDADRRANPSTMTAAKETTVSRKLRREVEAELAKPPVIHPKLAEPAAPGEAPATPRDDAPATESVEPRETPTAAPSIATPSGSRGLLWVGALGLVGIGLAAAALSWSAERGAPDRHTPASGPRASDTHASDTHTTDPPSAPTTPAPEPSPRAFTVFIASTPPGAEVFRGEERLGTTPTFTEIAPTDVAAHGLSFRVSLPGHAPYLWTQGASSEDVHVLAVLEPLAEPTPTITPDRSLDPRAAPPDPRVSRRSTPPRTSSTAMTATLTEDELRSSR
ncbi:MAG: protein kinase [Sandaracinaceae bacterium]|nr:protein kinase [Sandaracinaceae bacterium]